MTARWASHDENGDELVYTIYYRGDSETNWQLLKDKVSDRYYTFDATALPDGAYRIKVVASDAHRTIPARLSRRSASATAS